MDKASLLQALDHVTSVLPGMLSRQAGWIAFGQDSIVHLEGIARQYEVNGEAVYICLTRFLPGETIYRARRYSAPFAVRVLSGSYSTRWSDQATDEIPPFRWEMRMLPDSSYACTVPLIWQGIEMSSDSADNLVIYGRSYEERFRPRTGIYFPHWTLHRHRLGDLCEHFRQTLNGPCRGPF